MSNVHTYSFGGTQREANEGLHRTTAKDHQSRSASYATNASRCDKSARICFCSFSGVGKSLRRLLQRGNHPIKRGCSGCGCADRLVSGRCLLPIKHHDRWPQAQEPHPALAVHNVRPSTIYAYDLSPWLACRESGGKGHRSAWPRDGNSGAKRAGASLPQPAASCPPFRRPTEHLHFEHAHALARQVGIKNLKAQPTQVMFKPDGS